MTSKMITDGMKDTLMECQERELMGREPKNPRDFKFIKSFYSRGLIELRYYLCEHGRRKAGFYVTAKAKKILESYTGKEREIEGHPTAEGIPERIVRVFVLCLLIRCQFCGSVFI